MRSCFQNRGIGRLMGDSNFSMIATKSAAPIDPEKKHFLNLHHAWLTIYYHYRLCCWDSPMDEWRIKKNRIALLAIEKAMKDHCERFPDKIEKGFDHEYGRIRKLMLMSFQIERRRQERLFRRHRAD